MGPLRPGSDTSPSRWSKSPSTSAPLTDDEATWRSYLRVWAPGMGPDEGAACGVQVGDEHTGAAHKHFPLVLYCGGLPIPANRAMYGEYPLSNEKTSAGATWQTSERHTLYRG